eukprot:SAG11_NODE_1165_length_5621_cov_7.341543_3_plen_166_part_00
MALLLLAVVLPGLLLRTASASQTQLQQQQQQQQQQRTAAMMAGGGLAAVEALVDRRAPLLSPFLELTLQELGSSGGGGGSKRGASLAADATPEFFSIANSTSSPRNISIVANSPSALALGVHYYIKYVAQRREPFPTISCAKIPKHMPKHARAMVPLGPAGWTDT